MSPVPTADDLENGVSAIAGHFLETFHAEHRALRDLLLALIDAFGKGESSRARRLVAAVSALTGPHFRYEEEALYPGLVPIFGPGYVEKLLADHDDTIRNVRELTELADLALRNDLEEIDDDQAAWGIELTRELLPHLSDCDGLSIMVETLPEDDVVHLLATRDVVMETNLDLLTWAATVRGRHV
ncbi:hemerythrin domain-containing protein [Nonomuraea sp. NN258]|uniref:hemerythrin domain-containing protein n=1 Tax=Nonomuraea antri TaxID=2730852 RepID=UPI00156919A3|nr:hemerythrin domain-containing protein [Nonomuraea antri]NRQ37074.1 hemerythrin domain-containing protein [Nonomuraea antri]